MTKKKKRDFKAETAKAKAHGMAYATRGRARMFQDKRREEERRHCRGRYIWEDDAEKN